MEQIFYDLWAASLQDGYIGKLISIVEKAGGSRALYEMEENQMLSMGMTPRMIKHIINRRNTFSPESEYEKMMRENIKFIRYFDEEYPLRLKNIESAPYALFVKGEMVPENLPSVAIVGSRECSEYGRSIAEYFGARLAGRNISVISGMAYGIDGIAQMAALDAGGKTFSVLGCGVDVIYPPSNRTLYERLVEEGGGVISEYVPGTGARSRNFPPRNRIISGLCDVLMVVEARAKSGTLITADLAMDQGREVMIIPGRLTDPLSVGCVNLMKNGAFPALCVEDVIERLPSGFCNEAKYARDDTEACKDRHKEKDETVYEISHKKETGLSDEEQLVYSCLDYYPLNVNAVAKAVSMNISKLLTVLTSLEIKGIVKSVGQGAFVKIS